MHTQCSVRLHLCLGPCQSAPVSPKYEQHATRHIFHGPEELVVQVLHFLLQFFLFLL